MTLLEQIAALWKRLEPAGWGELLSAHGLTIPANSKTGQLQELLKKQVKVDRSLPGFGEFDPSGTRAIEPGSPARSLLYYALASPLVRTRPGARLLDAFPTLAELEAVENYVFAAREWSLDDVRKRAAELVRAGFEEAAKTKPQYVPENDLAIVVFASEFRTAADTVHHRCGDFCYARTGVTRTGTAEPYYDAATRGFVYRRDDDKPNIIRVAPARYSVWLAVALRGSQADCRPMDYNAMIDYAREYQPPVITEARYQEMFPPRLGDDGQRWFWVPLHKLFDGTECLSHEGKPLKLTVQMKVHQVNQKLARLFGYLKAQVPETQMTKPPFVETTGLADMSTRPEHGTGLVVPVPHDHLVEETNIAGQPLTFPVPPDPNLRQLAALKTPQIPGPRGQYRIVPGYAHVRHELRGGTVVDLNDAFPNPLKLLNYLTDGNYQALAFRDFTADGWVEASVPELTALVPERRAAYSLVCPPDFFPRIDQRLLLGLTELKLDWYSPPLALSDVRVPANVELKGAEFDPADVTITALVGLPGVSPADEKKAATLSPVATHSLPRHTSLPDDAAGVFHPGWDVGITYNNVYEHLTNSTLGSPFPEDVKLCAALSSYWPGVVPDGARVFPPIAPASDGSLRVLPLLPTVIPMTDREIGMEDVPAWDGSPRPTLVDTGKEMYVEYVSPTHADYVNVSRENRFSLVETTKVDLESYRARVLAMDRIYRV